MNNVIHTTFSGANQLDFTNYVYDTVYASANATPIINGTAVPILAGLTITVLVRTISETAAVYVIGKKKLIAPTVING